MLGRPLPREDDSILQILRETDRAAADGRRDVARGTRKRIDSDEGSDGCNGCRHPEYDSAAARFCELDCEERKRDNQDDRSASVGPSRLPATVTRAAAASSSGEPPESLFQQGHRGEDGYEQHGREQVRQAVEARVLARP